MKSKCILVFVCLVLMVFAFTSAAAENMETVTTISLQPGTLMADTEDVGQILDIAAIRIHSMPEGYGAFVLSLNDTDALTSLFRLEQDGIYVQCNALGQQSLYFTWEEIKDFVMEQLEAASAEMQDMDMPYDMSMLQSMMDGTMTEEQLLEMIGFDEELLAYIGDIQAKQVIESGSFTLNGSDAANTKAVTALDKDDLCRAIDLPIVREQIAGQLMMDSDYSQEEIDQMVDEQLAELKQTIEDGNASITSTVYTMDDEFIAMNFEFDLNIDDGSGFVPISVAVTSTRTTIESAKFYQLSVILTQGEEEFLNQYGSLYISDEFIAGQYTFYSLPDEPMLTAELNCDRSQAGQTTGELALTVHEGSGETAYVMFDLLKADNVTDTSISVYIGSSVEEIKAAFADSSLITIDLHTVVQPDSGFFTALQDATPETSVQLLQLSDEALENYMLSIQEELLTTLINAIENLPPDISDSLMQGMGGF